MKEPKNITRSFTVNKKLSDQLDQFANDNDLTVSWIIREALKLFLKRKK